MSWLKWLARIICGILIVTGPAYSAGKFVEQTWPGAGFAKLEVTDLQRRLDLNPSGNTWTITYRWTAEPAPNVGGWGFGATGPGNYLNVSGGYYLFVYLDWGGSGSDTRQVTETFPEGTTQFDIAVRHIETGQGKTVWVPLTDIDKQLEISVINADDRAWQWSFRGKLITVAPGTTVPILYTESDLPAADDGDEVFAILTSYQTYVERFNPRPDSVWHTTNTGQLIKPDAPNYEYLTRRQVAFLAGGFSKEMAALPAAKASVTINGGAAKTASSEKIDISSDPGSGGSGSGGGGGGSGGPQAQPMPGGAGGGAGSNSGPGNLDQNKNLEDTKTDVIDENGNLKDPGTMPVRSSGSSGLGVDAKGIADVLIENQKRNEILWERGIAADSANTQQLLEGLKKGGGLGDSGSGSGEFDVAGKLQQAGTKAGQQPAYAGVVPTGAADAGSMPGGPSGDVATTRIGTVDISLGFGEDGVGATGFDILRACRNLLIWAAAIGFCYSCGGVLSQYLVGLPQVSAADASMGPENVIPGVAQAKTWGAAAVIVAAVFAASAAIVGLLNTSLGSQGFGILGMMTGPGYDSAGSGLGLLNRYLPIEALTEFALMRAAFPFLVAPLYMGAAAILKFAKA